MSQEDLSQKFILKNIVEIRNYFLEEIEQNELKSRKHKNVCTTLNYIEHFRIVPSIITGFISVSDFVSFLGIPKEITTYAIKIKYFCSSCKNWNV